MPPMPEKSERKLNISSSAHPLPSSPRPPPPDQPSLVAGSLGEPAQHERNEDGQQEADLLRGLQAEEVGEVLDGGHGFTCFLYHPMC